jgi:2-keto-4-pentenoate hydratase
MHLTPEELLDHQDRGALWPGPLSADTAFDLDAGYRAALAVRALRMARGERPRGYKVGFTNRTIWARYNVFAPIWGTVWDSTITLCEGEGVVSLQGCCQPRLEPEAVFGFKATPPADATLQDLHDALDWVAPGFEVVQSHLPGWKFLAPDTVADGGLHARLLVGARIPVAQVAPSAEALDACLAQCRVVLRHDDGVGEVEQGWGRNVLDGPLRALHHCLMALRRCPGAPDLQPGDVVTTGTWTDAWPVAPGQRWTARFDVPLPWLTVRFE